MDVQHEPLFLTLPEGGVAMVIGWAPDTGLPFIVELGVPGVQPVVPITELVPSAAEVTYWPSYDLAVKGKPPKPPKKA